jgi:hypothetical protein
LGESFSNPECCFQIPYRLSALSTGIEARGFAEQPMSFFARGGDLTRNGQLSLVEFDGAPGIIQVVVGSAEIGERCGFAQTIANLARDHKPLFVEFDGEHGVLRQNPIRPLFSIISVRPLAVDIGGAVRRARAVVGYGWPSHKHACILLYVPQQTHLAVTT